MTDRCTTRGCPWPTDAEMHRPWCLGIPDVPHSPDAGHQHHPKKGMGGNNPNSQIVAVLCNFCHDKIDNTVEWSNGVISVNGATYYRAWDLHNKTLIEREIGSRPEAGEGLAEEATAAVFDGLNAVAAPAPDLEQEVNDGATLSRRQVGEGVRESDTAGRDGESPEVLPEAAGVGVIPGLALPDVSVVSLEQEVNDDKNVYEAEVLTVWPHDLERGDSLPQSREDARTGKDRGGAAAGRPAGAHLRGGSGEPLELPLEYTREEAIRWVLYLRETREKSPWLWGDLYNQCEERYGSEFTDDHSVGPQGETLSEMSGLPYPTLQNYRRVAKSYPEQERRPEVTWRIHQKLYKHPDRSVWLSWCVGSGATLSELSAALGTKRTKVPRYSVAVLRERGNQPFPGSLELRGSGRRYLAAFIDSLETL